jgi:molybdenum cofactor guanylyltransferase
MPHPPLRPSSPTDKTPTVDALILAGGQGSRLGGQDKGLIQRGNATYGAHLAQILKPYCRQVVISCNRHESDYRAIADQVVSDEIPGFAGPLAGVHAAASVSSADFLLICPCDTPNLDPRYPQRMLASLSSTDGPRFAHDGDRSQQLHILLPRQAMATVGEYLRQGGRSVKGWLFDLNPVRVDFSDCPQLFRNINTPDELQAWQAERLGQIG